METAGGCRAHSDVYTKGSWPEGGRREQKLLKKVPVPKKGIEITIQIVQYDVRYKNGSS